MTDWSHQRRFEDVREGDALEPVTFALPVYRLVMAAAATRDFNSIHHNAEHARRTGAPDLYASNMFLLGTWERAVREFIGLAGTITAIRGFRITSFTLAGDLMTVRGEVARTWLDGETGRAVLTMRSETGAGVSVGPGTVAVTLPRRAV